MTHSDDIIITADKHQIYYALFMALPLNIKTTNISGYTVAGAPFNLDSGTCRTVEFKSTPQQNNSMLTLQMTFD